VTWSPTVMLAFSPMPATRATGEATSVGVELTETSSSFSLVAPRESETTTVTAMVLSAAFGSLWRMATRPSAVGTIDTGSARLFLRASASTMLSPSGSTQAASTGITTVPPGASCGVGQSCWQASTPHQTGAVLVSSPTTVSVTVAGADSAAPSVTV
jgi:hypothetical protein